MLSEEVEFNANEDEIEEVIPYNHGQLIVFLEQSDRLSGKLKLYSIIKPSAGPARPFSTTVWTNLIISCHTVV
jgi:hypothetical protein